MFSRPSGSDVKSGEAAPNLGCQEKFNYSFNLGFDSFQIT